jgi:hypothetical protein
MRGKPIMQSLERAFWTEKTTDTIDIRRSKRQPAHLWHKE